MKILKSLVILFVLISLTARTVIAQDFEIYNGDTINYMDSKQNKQGIWKYFNDDKTVVLKEGVFKNNRKEGVWRYYYENANLQTEITYTNGLAKGYAKAYYETGQVMEEGFWDISHWTGDYKYYYENGMPAYVWKYNKEGHRTGKQQYFHQNGNVKIEGDWKDGKKDGKLAEYDTNGEIEVERTFKGGKLDVLATKVYKSQKNEVTEETIEQSDDTESELLEIFDGSGTFRVMKNGVIEREGDFIHGKLINGKKYYYDENGDLLKTDIYKNGVVIDVE